MPVAKLPPGVSLYSASVEQHLQAAFELINEAYLIECGDSGIGFKQPHARRYDSVDQALPYVTKEEGQHEMFVAMEDSTGRMLGCIYVNFLYEDVPNDPVIKADDGTTHAESSTSEKRLKRLYFGPLASRQRGIGSALVQYVEDYAKEEGCISIDINVINVRSDVIPWYERRGYVLVTTKPYPRPESCTRPVHFLYMRKPVVL